MSGRYLHLNYTWLWILAGGTGWAENWLLRSYGLDIVHRMAIVSGFIPLLVSLVLILSRFGGVSEGKPSGSRQAKS